MAAARCPPRSDPAKSHDLRLCRGFHKRKNALFAGHDEGGIAWGRIASLIETCKINGIEPFAYLKATLTAIANGHPQSGIDDLLPWNFKTSS